jgi:hypothetical protein
MVDRCCAARVDDVTGRVTRPPEPDDTFPSMKQRNPAMWWIAIITVAALVITTMTGLVAAILS